MITTWLYHRTEAPEGVLYTDLTEKDFAALTKKGWLDTPASFKEPVKPEAKEPDLVDISEIPSPVMVKPAEV